MFLNHIYLAVLWLVYCYLHSALASISVKEWARERMRQNFRFYRIYYTIFSFLFLLVLIYLQLTLHSIKLYATSSLIIVAGVVTSCSGLVLMIICIKKYFINLSGLRSLFGENTSPVLIITGIHRYVRHPLYLGTFGFIWGLFLVFPYLSFLIVNAIITLYTLIGISMEEDKLIEEFGESYRTYQRNVPMLIPHLIPRRVS